MSRHSRQYPSRVNLINQPAGFASRTVAMLIDIVAISLGLTIFTYLTSVVLTFFGLDIVLQEMESVSLTVRNIMRVFVVLSVGTVLAFANVTYFVLLWSLDGKTIGMGLLGLRVISVRTEDEDVRVLQALIRYVGLWLCVVPLLLGFLWILGHDERKGWHDIMSKTQVVYDWEARPDEHFLKRLMRQTAPELPPGENRLSKRVRE